MPITVPLVVAGSWLKEYNENGMDAQLWTLYLPSLATFILVGIGILFNNARISDVSGRIGDLNTNLNKRMDDLRADTFVRLERLEKHLDQLTEQVNRLSEQQVRLAEQQSQMAERYNNLEGIVIGKFEEVDARLARIESRLD